MERAAPPEGGFCDTVSAIKEAREWIEVSAAATTPLFPVKHARTAGDDQEAFLLRLVSGESGRWRATVRVSSVQCVVVCGIQREMRHTCCRLMESLSPGSIRKINHSRSPMAHLVGSGYITR